MQMKISVKKLPFSIKLLIGVIYVPLAMSAEQGYQKSVTDAAFVKQNEIYKQLIPIQPNNEELVWNATKDKILVVTWKSNSSYEKFIQPHQKTSDNVDYALWVTTAPQVQKFCQNYVQKTPKKSVELRLKQYLGLDPSWNYDVFVELWVSPDDLFRPCVDPETNDQQCELQFNQTVPQVKNIANYSDFYKGLYFKSFRASAGVPWTGLGYTYDWGNPENPVGASEFILVPNTPYEVKQVVPTATYCALIPAN